ncbi:unnamed protein product [Dibothriocephalus latus]|uniref:Uncharacterized protein n=1 Tax=Dibothriocephalus latus TaxID=60516 RepID=A0A3P7MWK2_DIBLA|nr:unnamed protein product [Dibothriocephalus latus]
MMKRRELKARREENRRALETRLEQNAFHLDLHLNLPSFRLTRARKDSAGSVAASAPRPPRLLTVSSLGQCTLAD